MKHRRNKVKREHGIIQNALPWLENLSRLSEVSDIIPGVIDVNHSSERGIVYKYKTQTGCKLLLKSNGSIQEAFIVTKNPERVKEWVEQEFPLDSPVMPSNISPNNLNEASKKGGNMVSSKLEDLSSHSALASLRKLVSKKNSRKNVQSIIKEIKEPNLADHLDFTMVKALQELKQSLETAKIQSEKSWDRRFPRK